MSYDIEKKLDRVVVQPMTEAEKNSVWLSVVSKQKYTHTHVLSFLFFKKYMSALVIALITILGGGGAVVASNNALPGDTLYPIDQTLESIQMRLTTDDIRRNDLKVRFAEERLTEAQKIIEKNSGIAKDINLSNTRNLEVEIDVFLNETVVIVEADDVYYGFTTNIKEKEEIILEIQEKYSVTREQIFQNFSFEVENRNVRPEDKEFLLNTRSIEFKSERQKQEFEGSLQVVEDLVINSNINEQEKQRLGAVLSSITAMLALNPNLDIEIKTQDGFEIEVEDGIVEIEAKDSVSRENRESDDDDYADDDGSGRDINLSQLPPQVMTYITNNFGGVSVLEAERYFSYFNVYLANGLELYFDLNGNFLRVEDDKYDREDDQDENNNQDNDDNDRNDRNDREDHDDENDEDDQNSDDDNDNVEDSGDDEDDEN